MVHEFINNHYFIVLDVNSGSVHNVDPIVYLIIKSIKELGFDNDIDSLKNDDKQRLIKEQLLDYYNSLESSSEEKKADVNDFDEAFDEILTLVDNKLLFTKDIYEPLLPKVKNRKTVIKAVCLHIAHDCNLACKYCFAEEGEYHGRRALMTSEIGKKALDFLVKSSGNRRNLEVDFFGGEPLMNFEVVKDIVKYGRTLEKDNNKNFRFTITTNGVLLSEEIMDFINEEMDNVVLSLDGRKSVNDKMRPFRNGKGSYDVIVPKFKKMVESRKGKSYYIRGTFTKYNLDFSNDILHFAELGFKELSMEPVVTDSNKDYAITEGDLPAIFEEYDKLAKEMVSRHKTENEFNFFHFMIDLDGGPCISKRLSGCGSGTEYVAITPWGDIYPCHQFVGNEEFLLGNVDDGIVRNDICTEFRNCNVYTKHDCNDCFAKYYCSGGCMANAYNEKGSIFENYELGCKLQRKRVECAIMMKIANKK